MWIRTTSSAVLAAGLAVSVPPGVAVADPGDAAESFELDCGAAGTFDVVTGDGRGGFTPAFDTSSNKVFIPVVFGSFTGTLTGPGGFEDTESEEGTTVKGSGKQRSLTTCSYSFEETFELTDEEAEAEGLPGAGVYTFTGTGTVTGQIRAR